MADREPVTDDMRASIDVAALVYAESKASFSAAEFTSFLQMGAVRIHEEQAGEFLDALVTHGTLREIGPGVYALPAGDAARPVNFEQPLWPEEEPNAG
jgi:hypothetical protein